MHGGAPFSVCLVTACLPVCLSVLRYPCDCSLLVYSPSCLHCLHPALTFPAGFLRLLERSTVPRLKSLLCNYTVDVSIPALHEAIRVPGEVADKGPMHLCDSWRRLAFEGELCAVSDLQATLTTNGVLLTVTVNVKTSMGVQIMTHWPAAIAQSLPLVVFAQTADATLRDFLLRWNPFFRWMYGNSFRTRLGNFWASPKHITCQSFEAFVVQAGA